MRKKKTYHQEIKRILRPEITHCLECQKKLQRCVTISDRRIITLKQVLRVVHCGYRWRQEECEGKQASLPKCRSRRIGLIRFYLWMRYCPVSRASSIERA